MTVLLVTLAGLLTMFNHEGVKPTKSDHLSDAQLALRGLSRETDIVLDAGGRFFAGGVEFTHPRTVAAFSRWIERTEDDRYVLRNDIHYVYLEVQGAPLHARGLDVEGDVAFLLLQGDEREPLDPATLCEGPDGTLYARVRDGSWPVRLHPAAALALAPLLSESEEGAVFTLGDARHVVSRVDDPLRP